MVEIWGFEGGRIEQAMEFIENHLRESCSEVPCTFPTRAIERFMFLLQEQIRQYLKRHFHVDFLVHSSSHNDRGVSSTTSFAIKGQRYDTQAALSSLQSMVLQITHETLQIPGCSRFKYDELLKRQQSLNATFVIDPEDSDHKDIDRITARGATPVVLVDIHPAFSSCDLQGEYRPIPPAWRPLL